MIFLESTHRWKEMIENQQFDLVLIWSFFADVVLDLRPRNIVRNAVAVLPHSPILSPHKE